MSNRGTAPPSDAQRRRAASHVEPGMYQRQGYPPPAPPAASQPSPALSRSSSSRAGAPPPSSSVALQSNRTPAGLAGGGVGMRYQTHEERRETDGKGRQVSATIVTQVELFAAQPPQPHRSRGHHDALEDAPRSRYPSLAPGSSHSALDDPHFGHQVDDVDLDEDSPRDHHLSHSSHHHSHHYQHHGAPQMGTSPGGSWYGHGYGTPPDSSGFRRARSEDNIKGYNHYNPAQPYDMRDPSGMHSGAGGPSSHAYPHHLNHAGSYPRIPTSRSGAAGAPSSIYGTSPSSAHVSRSHEHSWNIPSGPHPPIGHSPPPLGHQQHQHQQLSPGLHPNPYPGGVPQIIPIRNNGVIQLDAPPPRHHQQHLSSTPPHMSYPASDGLNIGIPPHSSSSISSSSSSIPSSSSSSIQSPHPWGAQQQQQQQQSAQPIMISSGSRPPSPPSFLSSMGSSPRVNAGSVSPGSPVGANSNWSMGPNGGRRSPTTASSSPHMQGMSPTSGPIYPIVDPRIFTSPAPFPFPLPQASPFYHPGALSVYVPQPPPRLPMPPKVLFQRQMTSNDPPSARGFHTSSIISDQSRPRFLIITGGDDRELAKTSIYLFDFLSRLWSKLPTELTMPLTGHTAVEINNMIIIFGGKIVTPGQAACLTNQLYRINVINSVVEPLLGGSADKKQPVIPVPRAGHIAAFILIQQGPSMIIHGGMTSIPSAEDPSFVISGDMWIYSIHQGIWHELRVEGSPALVGHSACIWDRHLLYIFGGRTAEGDLSNTLHCFDIRNRQWKVMNPHPRSPLPQPRQNCSLFTLTSNPFIFLWGGTDGMNCFSDLWAFDINLSIWFTLMAEGTPNARFAHTLAATDSYAYIFGGTNENKDMFSDLHSLDMQSAVRFADHIKTFIMQQQQQQQQQHPQYIQPAISSSPSPSNSSSADPIFAPLPPSSSSSSSPSHAASESKSISSVSSASSSSSAPSSQVHLHVDFHGEYVFDVPSDIKFAAFSDLLSEETGCRRQSFSIKYLDDSNRGLIIRSDRQLQSAFTFYADHKQKNHEFCLRLVLSDDPATPGSSNPVQGSLLAKDMSPSPFAIASSIITSPAPPKQDPTPIPPSPHQDMNPPSVSVIDIPPHPTPTLITSPSRPNANIPSAASSSAATSPSQKLGGGPPSASSASSSSSSQKSEAKEDEEDEPRRFDWTRGEILGSGAFGTVYKALDNLTGRQMAVKTVPLEKNDKVNGKLTQLQREVNILSKIKHKGVVQYLGMESSAQEAYIFLEYVPGGSITKVLTEFKKIPEPLIRFWVRQILEALSFLHSTGTIHCDIKGANILADDMGVVKLADFGASRFLAEMLATQNAQNSIRGTPQWLAPECIMTQTYSTASDIWSVGCVVIEMATGGLPWGYDKTGRPMDNMHVMFQVTNKKEKPPIPSSLSPDARGFIEQCLRFDPDSRPTAAQLLQHPFITESPPPDLSSSASSSRLPQPLAPMSRSDSFTLPNHNNNPTSPSSSSSSENKTRSSLVSSASSSSYASSSPYESSSSSSSSSSSDATPASSAASSPYSTPSSTPLVPSSSLSLPSEPMSSLNLDSSNNSSIPEVIIPPVRGRSSLSMVLEQANGVASSSNSPSPLSISLDHDQQHPEEIIISQQQKDDDEDSPSYTPSLARAIAISSALPSSAIAIGSSAASRNYPTPVAALSLSASRSPTSPSSIRKFATENNYIRMVQQQNQMSISPSSSPSSYSSSLMQQVPAAISASSAAIPAPSASSSTVAVVELDDEHAKAVLNFLREEGQKSLESWNSWSASIARRSSGTFSSQPGEDGSQEAIGSQSSSQ